MNGENMKTQKPIKAFTPATGLSFRYCHFSFPAIRILIYAFVAKQISVAFVFEK
jgi:hypothetical protein